MAEFDGRPKKTRTLDQTKLNALIAKNQLHQAHSGRDVVPRKDDRTTFLPKDNRKRHTIALHCLLELGDHQDLLDELEEVLVRYGAIPGLTYALDSWGWQASFSEYDARQAHAEQRDHEQQA